MKYIKLLFLYASSALKKIYNIIRNNFLMFINGNLKIGDNTIMRKVFIDKNGGGYISIGEMTLIHNWVCLMPYGGRIEIGNNCSINSFCHLSGNGGLKIGNNVRIATQCVLISANHIFENIDVPITFQGETRKGIVIEDDVWLGAGVRVLDGVTIGKGCVIGAGSVVTKSIEPYGVAVGIPAKVIKSRLNNSL